MIQKCKYNNTKMAILQYKKVNTTIQWWKYYDIKFKYYDTKNQVKYQFQCFT